MVQIGTPLSPASKKVILCGSGELGKEVAIELQRLGVEVIALDRYKNAPAMQVAHRSHVLSMMDGDALRRVIELEKPDLIVPEIEAIATDTLVELEEEGFTVIPTAKAARLTMNREGIRRLAAEKLSLKTSKYRFASDMQNFESAVKEIGFPCVVKPLMSSSGKGQSVVMNKGEVAPAWENAQMSARGGEGNVIVEAFIPFDYEITLLTVRHKRGTLFCAPIGHKQIDGDYRESWQPHPMTEPVLKEAERIAGTITSALGGFGIFGVELFIRGEDVYFSEVSPRPHDTGLVTLISQNLSEFALHVRAILELPIPKVELYGPSASCAILVSGHSDKVTFDNIDAALNMPGTDIRLFGKPEVNGHRRMGVTLARGQTIEEAREKAVTSANKIVPIF